MTENLHKIMSGIKIPNLGRKVYSHTTLKIPNLVGSQKLSRVRVFLILGLEDTKKDLFNEQKTPISGQIPYKLLKIKDKRKITCTKK